MAQRLGRSVSECLSETGRWRGRTPRSAGARRLSRRYGSRAGNKIIGGDGDDFLQGGPRRNRILAGNGNDTVRLRGSGPNTVLGGAGDDIVEAYAKGRASIDCGPGFDRVNIGFNRLVRTRNCELVKKLYKKR
jgi:hypothetical protein